jgi:hypothetical protein
MDRSITTQAIYTCAIRHHAAALASIIAFVVLAGRCNTFLTDNFHSPYLLKCLDDDLVVVSTSKILAYKGDFSCAKRIKQNYLQSTG